MAANELQIPESLKERFSEFGSIAAITKSLQGKIDKINDENKEAAGEDDEVAKTYHEQVDEATKNLSDLVGDIAELFGVTGERGTDASEVLLRGEDRAREQGEGWKPGDQE